MEEALGSNAAGGKREGATSSSSPPPPPGYRYTTLVPGAVYNVPMLLLRSATTLESAVQSPNSLDSPASSNLGRCVLASILRKRICPLLIVV